METASNEPAETPPETVATSIPEQERAAPPGATAGMGDATAAAMARPVGEIGGEQATLVDAQRMAALSAPHRQRISASPPRNVAAPQDAATYQDFAPPPASQMQMLRPAHAASPAAQPPAHVPWQAAQSWGPTTLSIDANTAAGASYLLWWLSGVLIYFNERTNRYVRFHAVQAILLTSALTVLGVSAYILAALGHDLWRVTHWTVFEAFGNGLTWLAVIFIVVVWLIAMVGAWTGNHLHWPIVGAYAERYAAPPVELRAITPAPPPPGSAGSKQ